MKKFICVVLILTMTFVFSTSVFASTINNISKQTEAVQTDRTVYEKAANLFIQNGEASSVSEAEAKLENDLQTLNEYYLEEKYICDIFYSEGIKYVFNLPYVDEKTIVQLNEYDGGVIITYIEGNKKDVVDYRDNGEIYVDGNKVEFTKTSNSQVGTIVPKSGVRHDYDDTSFVSGGAYKLIEQDQMDNVKTGKTIRNMTSSALGSILLKAILGLSLGITTALKLAKILPHAVSIIGKAELYNYNGDYMSMSATKWKNEKSDAFIQYYWYHFTYYLSKNCTGKYTTKDLYERRLVY